MWPECNSDGEITISSNFLMICHGSFRNNTMIVFKYSTIDEKWLLSNEDQANMK